MRGRAAKQVKFPEESFMKPAMWLMAGTMFLSTVFGADPFAEERYRMKTGRYTAAEEARREAVKKVQAAKSSGCGMHQCCTRAQATAE